MAEEYNPRLQATILAVVDNQIRARNPPETKQTLDRLMREGHSRPDARKLIGQAVVVEVFCAMKYKEEFNLARYLRNLSNLPTEPSER